MLCAVAKKLYIYFSNHLSVPFNDSDGRWKSSTVCGGKKKSAWKDVEIDDGDDGFKIFLIVSFIYFRTGKIWGGGSGNETRGSKIRTFGMNWGNRPFFQRHSWQSFSFPSPSPIRFNFWENDEATHLWASSNSERLMSIGNRVSSLDSFVDFFRNSEPRFPDQS